MRREEILTGLGDICYDYCGRTDDNAKRLYEAARAAHMLLDAPTADPPDKWSDGGKSWEPTGTASVLAPSAEELRANICDCLSADPNQWPESLKKENARLRSDNDRLTNALANDGALIEAHAEADQLRAQVEYLTAWKRDAEQLRRDLDAATTNAAQERMRQQEALRVDEAEMASLREWLRDRTRERDSLIAAAKAYERKAIEMDNSEAMCPRDEAECMAASLGLCQARVALRFAVAQVATPAPALPPPFDPALNQSGTDPASQLSMDRRDLFERPPTLSVLPSRDSQFVSALPCPRCGRLSCACTSVVP